MRKKRIIATCLTILLIFAIPMTALAMNSEDNSETNEQTNIQTASDTQTISDSEQIQAVSLSIDSNNRYAGMNCTYSEGYMPTVSNGIATIVLPLLCDGQLKGNVLQASVTLGDAENVPFVCKNYRKDIALSKNEVNGTSDTSECYLVSFALELKKTRINNSYPVTVEISANDSNGSPISAQYTVYVTISDGTNPVDENANEPVISTPKVMIQSYQSTSVDVNKDLADGNLATGIIDAGDKVQLRITLLNTSRTEDVNNMSVSITAPETFFSLCSKTNSTYIAKLEAGQTTDIVFEYQTSIAAPSGQYDFQLSYDYEYGKAATANGIGVAGITLGQSLKMKFDTLQIPQEVIISDTVEASVQAMNLSRTNVYNVRATIEADGLNANGTIYIGDIEAGAAMTATAQIYVSSLSKSKSSYGITNGIVTYYYEDSDGNEFTSTNEFKTKISSPFSEDDSEIANDNVGQWWIVILVVSVIIVAAAIYTIIRYIKGRRINEENN